MRVSAFHPPTTVDADAEKAPDTVGTIRLVTRRNVKLDGAPALRETTAPVKGCGSSQSLAVTWLVEEAVWRHIAPFEGICAFDASYLLQPRYCFASCPNDRTRLRVSRWRSEIDLPTKSEPNPNLGAPPIPPMPIHPKSGARTMTITCLLSRLSIPTIHSLDMQEPSRGNEPGTHASCKVEKGSSRWS